LEVTKKAAANAVVSSSGALEKLLFKETPLAFQRVAGNIFSHLMREKVVEIIERLCSGACDRL